MTKISSGLVAMDRFCDYVPVVSSVNNLVDLFLKAVVLPCMSKQSVNGNYYFRHIKSKSIARCVLLSIPFLNICVKFFDVCSNRRKTNQPFSDVLRELKKVIDERSVGSKPTNLDETNNPDVQPKPVESAPLSESEGDETVSESEGDESASGTDDLQDLTPQLHAPLYYAALRQG